MAQAERDDSGPFVRLRCPLCKDTSPVTSPAIDHAGDERRVLLSRWWAKHKESEHPYPSPIFESLRRQRAGDSRD